ncbi:hypothetical protein M0805_005927 [Coniferiporia weirii]|nr:hypothetical protein M0805_005927 [Coniferiporia weirii]
MAESLISRLLSLGTLKEIIALLDLLIKKAAVIGPNRTTIGTAEEYLEELTALKDAVSSIYNRTLILCQFEGTDVVPLPEGPYDNPFIESLGKGVVLTRTLLMEQENVLLTIINAQSPVSNTALHRNIESLATLALRAESQKLAQAREDILIHYDCFSLMCRNRLQLKLHDILKSAGGQLTAEFSETTNGIIKLLFYETPFQMRLNDLEPEITSAFSLLDSRCGSDGDYAVLLENLGRSWVDAFVTGSERSAGLSNCYVRLLSGLICSLEAEITLLPADATLVSMDPSNRQLRDPHIPQDRMPTSRIHGFATKLRKGVNAARNENATNTDLVMAEAQEARKYSALLRDVLALASKDVERERTRLFSVALCGMVKSGKSLFLSAVLGHRVLPSDELPSTAWPCRIRHVPRQTEPHLVICPTNATPIFQRSIEALRSKFSLLEAEDSRNGLKDFPFGTKRARNGPTREDVKFIWKDIAPATRANWEIFKHPSFILPNEAHGDADVYELLAQMNDVVRLCRSFGVDVPVEGKNWPTITVEFDSLRDEILDGEFEFYDLPGMGESSENYLGFEELEVSKNDWRTALPQILETSTGLRQPPLVICTHRDQVEGRHLKTQTNQVLNVFSSGENMASFKTQCVACSSRLGFGARILLNMSRECKPEYDSIFNESISEACRSCARSILGDSERMSRRTYGRFSDEDWKLELVETLEESGLTEATKQFTVTMAKRAQTEALQRGIKSMSRLIHELSTLKSETLLRLRRTKAECTQARSDFVEAEKKVKTAQESWKAREKRLRSRAIVNVSEAFDEFKENCLSSTGSIFRKTEERFINRHKDDGLSYQNVGGVLKFAEEKVFEEFIQDIMKETENVLEAERRFVVPKMRREIIDEEIRDQLLDLCTRIDIKLGGAQRSLFARLDTEMDDIRKSIRDAPTKDLLQMTSREVDKFPWFLRWIRSFWSQYNGYTIATETVIQFLRDEVIQPYVASLKASAESAFGHMMELGADTALNSVDALLDAERLAYELELSKKGTEPSQTNVASAVVTHMNFVAAEAALHRLEAELSSLHDGGTDGREYGGES